VPSLCSSILCGSVLFKSCVEGVCIQWQFNCANITCNGFPTSTKGSLERVPTQLGLIFKNITVPVICSTCKTSTEINWFQTGQSCRPFYFRYVVLYPLHRVFKPKEFSYFQLIWHAFRAGIVHKTAVFQIWKSGPMFANGADYASDGNSWGQWSMGIYSVTSATGPVENLRPAMHGVMLCHVS
jgi:hypothetical protein